MKNILTWREALSLNPKLDQGEAMMIEIHLLRTLLNKTLPHLELLKQENIEQWDEITRLRADDEQHEEIVKIYLDKITRLKKLLKDQHDSTNPHS